MSKYNDKSTPRAKKPQEVENKEDRYIKDPFDQELCIRLAGVASACYKSSKSIVHDLKALQQFYGAHIHLVKVFDSDLVQEREVTDRMDKFATFFELSDYSTSAIRDPEEAEAIQRFTESMDASMIAMATHFKRGLEIILAGHISKSVVSGARRPIWTKRVN